MQAKRSIAAISWVLGTITVIALLLNPPLYFPAESAGLALTLVVFIAFTLNMGVLLTGTGEISPAHLFSIMAALTISVQDALWITAVGALLGGLVQVARSDQWLPRRRVSVRSLRNAIDTMTHQTLTLLVGAGLYVAGGGRIPLGYMEPGDLFALTVLGVSFAAVYLLFFALRVRLEGRALSSVLAEDWFVIGGVLLLPIPFGILSAVVYIDLDNLSLLILMAGMLLVVIGVYGLSRTRYRYHQQVQELSSLSAVSQALRTDLNLDDLLVTIYQQVAGLLSIDLFAVALRDSLTGEIHYPVAARQGERVHLPARAASNHLLDHVIQTGSPLLIERHVEAAAAGMGRVPPDAPCASWLGVPLLAAENRAMGAITVASSDPERALGEADKRLLMNIAAQAAIAIDNAQLYGQAQARTHQLAALNNISALLAGSLSPEKVVNLVTSSMAAIANADAVAMYLYWDNRANLMRNVGLSEAFSAAPPVPLLVANRPPGEVALSITDVQAATQLDPALREMAAREEKRAWVELLLVSGETPEGIVIAYFNEPRILLDEELTLLRTFAVQAAMAIKNARLYTSTDIALDQRVSQLQALYDVGQQLSATLNPQKLFQRILEYAISGAHADAGVVVVGDEHYRDRAQVAAYRGYPEGAFDGPPTETGLTSRVYATGIPALVPDVQQVAHYRALNPATRSQLSVPIKRGEDILGVITIESARLNAFGDADINYVSQLAIQASIAIENARLFKRVAENRDQLQVILDSMTEGILLVDRKGRIALANPRITSLLGISPRALVGRLMDDLLVETGQMIASVLGFKPDDLRLLMADLRAGEWDPERSETAIYEMDLPQQAFVSRHIAPVQDEAGALVGLLMVFVDQTEEHELNQAREDLSRMIVHDLRSPLTAVTASLKLMHDLVPKESDFAPLVQRTTEASMQAVRKLLNLVDSLLDIGKMESGQPALNREPTHLSAVVDSVVSEMDSLARELDITLSVVIPYDLPPLDIDPGHIERVILNLLDNALKFTPAEGRVALRAFLPGESSAPQEFVRVEVSDTGPGIPDEHKERLFNRFVQVEGSRGRRRGTGLGLTFCRLSLKAHGGKIWIEDNPAGGAIFAFTLPLADPGALGADGAAL
ncbi:MAG: GAF domain-containing protein [Anaerolineae bacterium]|nr:GAF domain-containing protein [Anaerolineae bacterium]